jgi:hypothetical protein
MREFIKIWNKPVKEFWKEYGGILIFGLVIGNAIGEIIYIFFIRR